MSEPLDLLPETIRIEGLERGDDPRMKPAALLLEQAPVRDVVRERMLEGVLEVRKRSGLIEKLGDLQVVESAMKRFVGQVGDRLEKRERHVLADDRGDLQ